MPEKGWNRLMNYASKRSIILAIYLLRIPNTKKKKSLDRRKEIHMSSSFNSQGIKSF